MLRLKRFVCIVLMLPVIACTEGKPPQSQGWSEATGAEAYERLWWKAIQDRDFKTAELHLAPAYMLTTPAGIVGHDKAMQYFQNLDLTSVTMGDVQVQPDGADMVVSYVATMGTKASPAPQRFYMTTVWQQVKKGWIAIAHTEAAARE
jgi:Domain of unknown function (DUF4440)